MDVGTRKSSRRRQGTAKLPPGEAGSEGHLGQGASNSVDQMAGKSPLRRAPTRSPVDQIATESPSRQVAPFRRPTSPPKKRPKLKSRGGKGLEQEEDEEYFKVNFENLMEFLKLRVDPKAFDIVTVNELATPPEMWLDFYLCRVAPVEERLDAFRNARWTRMYFLLKSPLPAFILDVEPLKKWSRLQDQLRKNSWAREKGYGIQEESKFHQNTANNCEQALVATRIQTENVTASSQTLKTTREKLLQLIRQVIGSYVKKGKLSRRGEQSLMELIETGNVPDDLVYNMDPRAINLLVSRLRILQIKKKSRRGPVLILNNFSIS